MTTESATKSDEAAPENPKATASPKERDDRGQAEELRKRCLRLSVEVWIAVVVAALTGLWLLFETFDDAPGAIVRSLGLSWVVCVVCVLSLAGWVGYWAFVRKPLLARRKLHELAAAGPVRRGLAPVWLPGLVAAIALAVALPVLRQESGAVASWDWLIYVLALVLVLSLAVTAAHLAEYALVSSTLAQTRAQNLEEAIEALGGAAVTRLRKALQKESKDGPRKVLSDQEVEADALETLVQSMQERLEELDGQVSPWVEQHGNVALLFHPDYLPHMSNAYLQVSQWRGLNIVPRRVQLLARHWTLAGLDSEFVVVHDVSDIRQGFPAPSPAAMGDENGKPYQLENEKWRLRSLKKRAIVHVAPNGANLGISIEEERQFNI